MNATTMSASSLEASSTTSASQRPSVRRAILSATLGNAMEWFDFGLFAMLAIPISKAFFPAANPITSFMLTMGTFTVGFVARPLGSIVIGRLADQYGRRPALLTVLAMMAFGTLIMVFAPTYAEIGVAGPALIILARLIQGFAVGGEVGSAISFLMEIAPKNRKAMISSLQMSGQFFAAVLGASLVSVLANTMAPQDFSDWGWRIPFAIGLLIVPIGLYMRATVHEPQAFVRAKAAPVSVSKMLVLRNIAIAAGIVSVATAGVYMMIAYMPSHVVMNHGVKSSVAQIGTLTACAVAAIATPLFGLWSDRIGTRRIMLPAAIVIAVIPVPMFMLIAAYPVLPVIIASQVVMGLALSAYSAPGGVILSELFPVRMRSVGVGVGYNLATVFVGGAAPMLMTWMVSLTSNVVAPGFYVAVAGVLSVVTLLMARANTSDDVS